jgi:hypothetical protein
MRRVKTASSNIDFGVPDFGAALARDFEKTLFWYSRFGGPATPSLSGGVRFAKSCLAVAHDQKRRN